MKHAYCFVALLIFGALLPSGATFAQSQTQPWSDSQVIKPEQLVKQLSLSKEEQPVVLQVGFLYPYQNGHIIGSSYAGPASRPEGLRKLKHAASTIPRTKEIVLYCGCCAWDHCPNIRPAFRTMQKLGFKDIRLLYLPHDLTTDWIEKNYPIATLEQK